MLFFHKIFACKALLVVLLQAGPLLLLGQEQRLAISAADGWLPRYFDKVHLKQDREAGSIITLQSMEKPLQEDLDLLLFFNQKQKTDQTGQYHIVRHPVYSDQNVLFGGAAGFFQGRGGLHLKPSPKTFLGYGITDHDFSINFWFYPFFVENGEVLFEWEGHLELGGRVIPQRITAIFRSNRLVWQFRNVFLAPRQDTQDAEAGGLNFAQNNSLYEVRSKPYIPESWYHHQLVYDEDNATLEIFSNSLSDGVAQITTNHAAGGARMTLMIENPKLTTFAIGSKYFGFIDEWEISRIRERVDLRPIQYYFPSGAAYSQVLDLQAPSAQVQSVRLRAQQPADSQVLLYAAITDDKHELTDPTVLDWKLLGEQRLDSSKLDGGNFQDFQNLQNFIGQYVQFKVELLSDTRKQQAPFVQGLELRYQRWPPPAPPAGILLDNLHKGGTYVQWQPSISDQVQGYKVFAGRYSGQYLEPGYPVDVGDSTSFLFSDLEEKVQYFFVLASYDKYGQTGPFSLEYSIRHISE